MDRDERRSIYKLVRSIRKKENSLYNVLRSIYDDSKFVAEIRSLRPSLPMVANLRCGLWYAPRFDETCYFKSTDGHNGNWSFNLSRLNLHIALLAARSGGCMIVDSTKRGKRFPDSMNKTIPMWACVLNRCVAAVRKELMNRGALGGDEFSSWDCELHVPSWVSETEKSSIESRVDGWVKLLLATGTDLTSLAAVLMKPLRALWVSQRSIIWLNEIPENDSLAFTPVILVSASRPSTSVENHRHEMKNDQSSSYIYIPGAADDEETWSRGLTPNCFWSHALEIIDGGSDVCESMVLKIVNEANSQHSTPRTFLEIQWIGSTGLAVASALTAMRQLSSSADISVVDCTGDLKISVLESNFLSLRIETSKMDRHSLERSLPVIMAFAERMFRKNQKLLIVDNDGEDICICVLLAILIVFFDTNEKFHLKTWNAEIFSKLQVHKRLAYVSNIISAAKPSRGHLKQVYNYLLRY